MNKIILTALVLISLSLPQSSVSANDGVSNSALWIHSNKLISCVSVENADEINSGSDLFVFDYSPSNGVEKGKPWTTVEKGKCYEIDAVPQGVSADEINVGELFVFINPSPQVRKSVLDYGAHAPTDSIADVFGDRSYTHCGEREDINPRYDACIIQPYTIDLLESGLGYGTYNMIRSIGFSIQNFINSKYNFGDGVTGGSSSYSDDGAAVVNSSEIEEVRGIYQELAQSVESVIEKCDERIREEIRLTLNKDEYGNYNYNIERQLLSRYKDGTDREFVFEQNYQNYNLAAIRNSGMVLENIGCKDEVVALLESKKEAIAKADALGDRLRVKFATNRELDWYISPRTEEEKKELATFYGNTESESAPTTNAGKIIEDADKTELETPTLEEKMDIVSSGTAMKLYWLLPLVGVIAIALILFSKKRK